MAFYAMDPWGEYRADLRNAQLIAVQAKDPPPLHEMVLFPDERNNPPKTEDEQWEEWDAVLDRAATRSERDQGE